MLYSELPTFLRESTIFSVSEIDLLLTMEALPTDEEVDAVRDEHAIFDLLNAFIGDEGSRQIHLQIHAQKILKQGDISKAWKVILL